jgi:putative DNA primase/helicase
MEGPRPGGRAMTAAREIALALGGRRAQRCADGTWMTCCPVASHGQGRGDRSPSLTLKDGDRRILVKCFAGCDTSSIIAELRRRGLLSDANDGAKTGAPEPQPSPPPHSPAAPDAWRRIWKDSVTPYGTAVEVYLAGRGLAVPPLAQDVIRFHGACPFGRGADGRTIRTAAMVALVRGIVSNVPQAIHRTAIDRAGNKIAVGGKDRMALGPTAGGAVKITADEDVIYGLGIAEGIETALSLQRLPEWCGSPVCSVLNENGLKTFPLLASVETLVIAVDHDPPGKAAAREVTKRWHEAGREVLLVEAKRPGADINDVIRGGARHAG